MSSPWKVYNKMERVVFISFFRYYVNVFLREVGALSFKHRDFKHKQLALTFHLEALDEKWILSHFHEKSDATAAVVCFVCERGCVCICCVRVWVAGQRACVCVHVYTVCGFACV